MTGKCQNLIGQQKKIGNLFGGKLVDQSDQPGIAISHDLNIK